MLAVADVAKIAAIFDRRFAFELGVSQLVFDVPMRIPVTGRITKTALKRCDSAINGAFAPARHASESVLGGGAESGAISR